jgi:hypothetical protein
LHSALERLGLLTALAAMAALAPLLGLDSCLPPNILIILVSLNILTTCTRTLLIVGPRRRNLWQLRILAASIAGRLRNGHRH